MPKEERPRLKRCTGIPSTFLKPANANQQGALVLPSGQIIVQKIAELVFLSMRHCGFDSGLLFDFRAAYNAPKKELPPFVPPPPKPVEHRFPEVPLPAELTCPICSDIMTECAIVNCCGWSFCDECKSN
jgi:E3 ubiquitin-protein ligase RBBP6